MRVSDARDPREIQKIVPAKQHFLKSKGLKKAHGVLVGTDVDDHVVVAVSNRTIR